MMRHSRRALFSGAVGLAAALSAPREAAAADTLVLPFHGAHQNGIATPPQAAIYFAAFDLVAERRDQVAALMRAWTEAAVQLAQGAPESPPARLTTTFGFGQTLFSKDGIDRYGLAGQRPAAFVDLPKFPGDQLIAERTGGDLVIQICSDDPQTNLHAARQFMRLAEGSASVRWVQSGFVSGTTQAGTPRNLMGFKDGTFNIATDDAQAMGKYVWVGDEAGAWMRGGTYIVARPTRIALEHWDKMKLAFQEQTVGRHKDSGAPIGGTDEFAALDLDATDADGNPRIAENAHVRLAAPASNDGAQILRRSYSYDNGVAMVAERWPPWRHALELDAGLLFVCFQRDPRSGFIKIFEKMSRFDMMNQFVTPIGGGLYACPGGITPGRYLGQDLFEGSGSM